MDPNLVRLLAVAAASLEEASEAFDAESPAWNLIVDTKWRVVALIAHEVNSTWPEPPPEIKF
jgi:hypothetical protein